MLAVISGGNWNNASDAGLWCGNLNNYRSNSNNNVGLRCDYGSNLKALTGEVEPQGCALLRYAK